MRTIYKYRISPAGHKIKMPVGAQILSVAFQGEEFCLWALVETDAAIEERNIVAIPTGFNIPEGEVGKLQFIGTGHMALGLVFHAFEVKEV